jgi:serine acetyltransferase
MWAKIIWHMALTPFVQKLVFINEGAFVGMYFIVLHSARVGRYTSIGPSAVVTNDEPHCAILGGFTLRDVADT